MMPYQVYKGFYHTVILCHLYRLIRALDLHHSGIGWQIIRRHLSEMIPRDNVLQKLFFEEAKFQIKCFLRMKCDGLYRDVSKFLWKQSCYFYLYLKIQPLMILYLKFIAIHISGKSQSYIVCRRRWRYIRSR